MKKIFKIGFYITISIAVIFTFFYYSQESLIFFPTKTAADYQYEFQQNFEEVTIKTADNVSLNGVLFKTDSVSKGLIFYLHGNARNVVSWSSITPIYNKLGYDIFILDYRGYGKSEGKINNEAQFFSDVQSAYNQLKLRYDERKIVIIGRSIGTGPAAMLTANNNSKMLILLAPYYSLLQMMEHNYPFLPTLLLKYKFETYKFIAKTKAPIVIFHGDKDQVIPFKFANQLKQHFKTNDQFITLKNAGHHRMNHNTQYQLALKKILD